MLLRQSTGELSVCHKACCTVDELTDNTHHMCLHTYKKAVPGSESAVLMTAALYGVTSSTLPCQLGDTKAKVPLVVRRLLQPLLPVLQTETTGVLTQSFDGGLVHRG